ncbi:MAG TPA: malonic semialdehyde reductase [Jatrophihabitans sp.]|nr:malonic semialdehyde reductase [Jatrophihabitans sp.]
MTAAVASQTAELELAPEAQELLFRSARTANKFTDEPVSDEQLRAIYDLIKYAPTAMNQQPLRAVVVRSEEGRARLVSHLSEGNRAKTAVAPVTVILAADVNFHDELPRVFPHFPGARDLFTGDVAAREQTAKFNAALQVGYFILGVRAAGLAAGPMTGFDAEAINADFFPDGEHKVLAVVNIGRPAAEGAWFDRLPRLDFDDVVSTV